MKLDFSFLDNQEQSSVLVRVGPLIYNYSKTFSVLTLMIFCVMQMHLETTKFLSDLAIIQRQEY